MNPKVNREKMISIMFESFNVPNCYVAIQAVLSLYAAGRTTGLVVDSGDGVSHTVPVFEGFSIPHAVTKMDIAGRVLTNWAQKLLLNHGHNFTSSAELEIVKDIKEKTCFVAQNFEEEKAEAEGSSAKDVTYTLPDKSVITVKAEVRMSCPELLFRPQLDGKSCKSLDALTMHSVTESDIDVRKALLANLILSGGTTMYEGLPARLKQEVTNKAPAGAEVKVIAQPDRKFAVWTGGSTLASLSTFASSWISYAEYEEHGAAIVHRKCN